MKVNERAVFCRAVEEGLVKAWGKGADTDRGVTAVLEEVSSFLDFGDFGEEEETQEFTLENLGNSLGMHEIGDAAVYVSVGADAEGITHIETDKEQREREAPLAPAFVWIYGPDLPTEEHVAHRGYISPADWGKRSEKATLRYVSAGRINALLSSVMVWLQNGHYEAARSSLKAAIDLSHQD